MLTLSPALSRERSFGLAGTLFKAFCIFLLVATPVFGVWLGSSLAAYAGKSVGLPIAAGLLLFPGLPLAWEGWARWRESKRKVRKKRFLTFFDRLVLRTLAINALFLITLLGLFPQRAFVALSTRGDWMLDGHHGPTAESTRKVLLTFAGAVEWLYDASHDNPYRDKEKESDEQPTPSPTPTPTPVPKPVPTPVASTSSSAPPPEEPPPPVAPPGQHWPMPATLHPVVTSMPPEVEVSIPSVGKYIAERESDPFLRVKALHDWVADRIAYNAPSLKLARIPQADGDADSVFRTRKGVCAGYAHLMQELGKATGDKIVYVVGDARSQSSPMEAEGHAWNAVQINGAWYLIDATWDAGSVGDYTFTKRYSTDYLFTPAHVFAVQHFPDQPKWQLLEKPIDRTEFFRRPVLAPSFFARDLTLKNPDRSQVTSSGTLDVLIGNPQNTFLLVAYEPKQGGKSERCTTNKHTTAHCTFPAAGTYDVNFFVNEKELGQYAYAGSVQVNARP